MPGSPAFGPEVSIDAQPLNSTDRILRLSPTILDDPPIHQGLPSVDVTIEEPKVQRKSPAVRDGNSIPRITRSASRSQAPEPTIETAIPLLNTTSDGIDPDFLAALPPELRIEVKRDHARTRAKSERPPVKVPLLTARAKTISPAKPKGMHAAAHITKQLRPKLKTQMKASDIAALPLYNTWSKVKANKVDIGNDEQVDRQIGIYNVSELLELNIDPSVFAELPTEVRKEVVDEERRKRRQRKVLHHPADRSRYQSRERETTRTASLSPSRSSRAGSAPAKQHQRIAINRPAKPVQLKAKSLPDVLETVSQWVESRGSAGPAHRDAAKVKVYLVKCMSSEAGLGGIENAVEVLKWMRTVLLEYWEKDGQETREAGKEWWTTWKEFKGELDDISVKQFGAPIKL